jgi:hypothetical protein
MTEARDPRPAYILADVRRVAVWRATLADWQDDLAKAREAHDAAAVKDLEIMIKVMTTEIATISEHLGFFDYPEIS